MTKQILPPPGVEVKETCDTCGGTGDAQGPGFGACPDCEGLGWVAVTMGQAHFAALTTAASPEDMAGIALDLASELEADKSGERPRSPHHADLLSLEAGVLRLCAMALRVVLARNPAGATLRRLREAAGLSQLDLAEQAGTTQAHICRIERGEYVPTPRTMRRLSQALKGGEA